MLRRSLLLISAAFLFVAGHAWGLQPVSWEQPYHEAVSVRGQDGAVFRVPKAVPNPASQTRRLPAALPASRGEAPRPVQAAAPAPRTAPKPPGFAAAAGNSPRSAPDKPRPRLPILPELSAPGNGISRIPAAPAAPAATKAFRLPVRAKALYCLDCSSNKVVLAQNISEPLPIASITKLLTAMTVIDEMKLDAVVETPKDIAEVPKHRVGIRATDLFTNRDLLHGMLIESGNDCAEALASAYPKGGRSAFIAAMNRKARLLGASRTKIYTPSGLDAQLDLGRKDGRDFTAHCANIASAEDVALIARHAFQYPLIRRISSMKTYTMRTRNITPRNYPLVSNDKLLDRNLPLAGAKTGFTNMAGKCIVALFKDQGKEHMVVVLNTPKHFKAAERIYRWASQTF